MNAALRNPMVFGGAALAAFVLVASTLFVVPETKQAVVLRFGEVVATYNPYRANEKIGQSGAGLAARIPFVDRIVWVDKRVRAAEMDRQQVLSNDQLRLNIDAFARFRIVDPLRMVTTAGSEENVANVLRTNLGSALRAELGKRTFATLLSPERGQVMDNIRLGLDRVARQYGARIVDVRIKKADLPEGTPLTSAYERMRTARAQEALTIKAQGYKQAQIIRADADASAAAVYAAAFNKDPQFYDFYRSMQSYERTFGTDGTKPEGATNIIMSPGNGYLRNFRGQ